MNIVTLYSGEFKVSVLQYRQLHQLTYAQTAKHFGIKQGATIATWNKTYLTQDYDGLCKPIGRPSKKAEDSTMTHKPSKQPLTSSEKVQVK
ncbi:helix-turn-helix domain-containing protein [Dolosicoccus paucivorans]|uniref:Helix-turn-helix domain-containing protein n=1 Tax=Dolosicoccus paucivorans TaxID=84521 RepID=A0A1G8MVM4_9LACT|nr:helix-turn-helix domain-containing protein [Dolosicoccus paucivorans]PMB84820.1 helix-turn-helix domain-containing protein [Dolosicoccus paucivorans]PMC58538.1 helix-turn-helix domain-containing protein [Dolosicoccus paucivorans]SDI71855.1 Helix-turn-helix domain [Dolosicoccus paucivorans]